MSVSDVSVFFIVIMTWLHDFCVFAKAKCFKVFANIKKLKPLIIIFVAH